MNKLPWLRAFALIVVVGGSAYYAGRARADAPTTGALVYSGVLQQGGQDVDGDIAIDVLLYDAATGGKLLCGRATSGLTTVTRGYFQIALLDSCVTHLQQTANVWSEVSVNGVGVGRTKIGSVPYALQADNASGVLAKRIASLEARPVTYGARITNDGTTCQFERESGKWLQAIAYTTTYTCTLTLLPGIFKGAPTCTVTPETVVYPSVTASPTTVVIYSGGNTPHYVLCTGERAAP